MKRLALAALLAYLAVSAGAVSRKENANRAVAPLAPVYINDGDTDTMSVVVPTTHTWTQVLAARATRRRADITVINSETTAAFGGVCLSSTTNSGDSCSGSRAGYELHMSTPAGTVTLYGQTAWYARIRGGDANQAKLRVNDYYDSGD